jgi:2-polyprenyl-3-methyl-5-hydroxy-6-metoxy-1,4-benzoquinol methylase
MEPSRMTCIVCNTSTRPGLFNWHHQCHQCRYEGAALSVAINQAQAHDTINEAEREASLKSLRLENFSAVVAMIRQHAAPGARRLLDVGSAHGWFLQAAAPHFEVLGVEPDEEVGRRSQALGLPVRLGFFPQALAADEQFDIIVFNDVIEHIPDIRAALQACHARLSAGGTLVLNLPSSRGLFYRLSKLFASVGLAGPFERMWQKGMPSPHVHYFNPRNLTALLESEHFSLQHSAELAAIKSDGLLERLSYFGKVNPLKLYAQYAAIRCLVPLLRLFASDIIVCIYRKT